MKKLNTSKVKKEKTKTPKITKETKKETNKVTIKKVEKNTKKVEKETIKKPIKKVVMGIIIPYYNNSLECELNFKRLMEDLDKQLTDDMILFVWEDGQASEWLLEYKDKENIVIKGSLENKGVSYARNKGIEYLKDKVNYILFIDSDDVIENNYLPKMCEYCADNTHEIIESTFLVKGQLAPFMRDSVRSGVAGSALQTKIIGDFRFEENLQIGEDTEFMQKVCDLTKYRKKHAPTQYNYQLGANENSLTMRHIRKEIRKER